MKLTSGIPAGFSNFTCQKSAHMLSLLRPHGQVVKTSPFHGGNTSSNLVGVIFLIWRHSQAVRRGSAKP